MSRKIVEFVPSVDNYLVRVISAAEAKSLYPQFQFTESIQSVDTPNKVYVFSLVEVVATHNDDVGYEGNEDTYSPGDILFTNLTSCPKIKLGIQEYFIIDTFDIQGELKYNGL